MLVYVLNKDGNPLMPCSPCRAKRLLKSGEAKVVRREPFAIQLLFGAVGYKQKTTIGCDSGFKVSAFSATANQKVIKNKTAEKGIFPLHKIHCLECN